jgi:hypothetical protein
VAQKGKKGAVLLHFCQQCPARWQKSAKLA